MHFSGYTTGLFCVSLTDDLERIEFSFSNNYNKYNQKIKFSSKYK